MAFGTLVSTDALAERAADSDLVIVDCRFRLDDVGWGEREYLAAHIPGAVYAHLDRHLSGVKTGANGRHPLPDAETLARTLEWLGVGNNVQVVAYDQDNGSFASRLWWLLRWLGHDAVAVLDGGFAKWTAERRPTESGSEQRPLHAFTASMRPEMIVEAAEVEARLGSPSWRLVDARAPERYRGDIEPIDKTPGHIPTAVNHPYQRNISADGVFLSSDALLDLYRATLGGVPADHAICYCGSGVTACHTLLALEHAGLRGAKLYPGSWSEWSADPSRPIERGDQTTG
jgi:thiosulfate/3-mercaptopyruvate sulfurtransferase